MSCPCVPPQPTTSSSWAAARPASRRRCKPARRRPGLSIAVVEPRRGPLLPAGLDPRRRRRLQPQPDGTPNGAGDAAPGAVDPGRCGGLRTGAQSGGAGRRGAGRLSRPRRRPGHRAKLGRHRGPARHARPQRRDLELHVRDGALHLRARAVAARRTGPVHPTADADQVRGRAAEGDVSLVRSLASQRHTQGHRGRVPYGWGGAVRGRILRPVPDGVRREVRRPAQLRLDPEGGGRPSQKSVLRNQEG